MTIITIGIYGSPEARGLFIFSTELKYDIKGTVPA